MMLDSKNKLIGDVCVTTGTVNSSLLTPREIFLKAFSFHAVSIILVHNHPSGDPSPSRDDIDITQRIYDAGNLIGIQLLDHIIIGGGSYVSIIAERRLIER
jgi:DNA repair protein RadC